MPGYSTVRASPFTYGETRGKSGILIAWGRTVLESQDVYKTRQTPETTNRISTFTTNTLLWDVYTGFPIQKVSTVYACIFKYVDTATAILGAFFHLIPSEPGCLLASTVLPLC